MKKILAVSGSLRAESANASIIRAIRQLGVGKADVFFFNGYDTFPHFDPALDVDPAPAAVAGFRKKIKESDGVILCTPEYAFGIPGSFKNALDWTVSSGELNEKPVAVISASPLPSGGIHALNALLLVCSALGTKIPERGTLSIAAVKNKMNGQGEIMDEQTLKDLAGLLSTLLDHTG